MEQRHSPSRSQQSRELPSDEGAISQQSDPLLSQEPQAGIPSPSGAMTRDDSPEEQKTLTKPVASEISQAASWLVGRGRARKSIAALHAKLDLIPSAPTADIDEGVESNSASQRLRPATYGMYKKMQDGLEPPEGFTQLPAQLLGKEWVIAVEEPVAGLKDKDKSRVAENANRILRMFNGEGGSAIAASEKRGPSTVYSAQDRFLRRVARSGGTPAVIHRMILATMELGADNWTQEKVHEVFTTIMEEVKQQVEVSNVDIVPVTEDLPPNKPEQLSWQEQALEIAASWSSDEQISLRALVGNKWGSAVTPACARIRSLLAQFAPNLPARQSRSALLDQRQWHTLNLLSGYKTPNGSPTTPESLALRLVSLYNQDFTGAGETIVESLQLLVDAEAEAAIDPLQRTDTPTASA